MTTSIPNLRSPLKHQPENFRESIIYSQQTHANMQNHPTPHFNPSQSPHRKQVEYHRKRLIHHPQQMNGSIYQQIQVNGTQLAQNNIHGHNQKLPEIIGLKGGELNINNGEGMRGDNEANRIHNGHKSGGRRVEYIPYEQRYLEYEQQVIKVPVERYVTDYYKVEHVTEYVPIEKEDIVYETVPQEVVTMKLHYVPVEQKLIHITDKHHFKQPNTHFVTHQTKPQPDTHTISVHPSTLIEAPLTRRSRTRYVTADNYDPIASHREIERILTESQIHQTDSVY